VERRAKEQREKGRRKEKGGRKGEGKGQGQGMSANMDAAENEEDDGVWALIDKDGWMSGWASNSDEDTNWLILSNSIKKTIP